VGRCGETLQVAQTVQSTIPSDDISVTNVNDAINTCQKNLTSASATLIPSSASTEVSPLETPTLELPAITPTP
jgi:hypothetical protein